MFGYVTVDKSVLTEDEYKVFCAYYCGLCKSIGKNVSQISRLGLSYDITFLALVLASVSGGNKVRNKKCILHPFTEKEIVSDNTAVSYAASAGCVLAYEKFRDDFADDRNIKALLSALIIGSGYKRACSELERECEIIKKQLRLLCELEKSHCASIDDTADAFAKILETLFTPDFIENENERRALAWLGYNLGRWIYIMDAVNDFEDDRKSGAYNTLSEMGYADFEKCSEDMRLSLTLTLDGIASAFELIDFKCNKDLIGKIVYIGLKEKQQLILDGRGKDKNESIRGSRRKRKCGRGNSQKSV